MSKHEELFGEGWARILKPLLDSYIFKDIGKELRKQQKEGIIIYPKMDDIFRAFRECPWEKTIAVLATTNAYVKGQADGLAFSCAHAQSIGDTPAILKKVFDAVEKDVAKGLYLDRSNDLSRWAAQGVLLLNLDLTTVKNKPKSHLKLWEPFMKHLFRILGTYRSGITYGLIGKEAKQYNVLVNPLANDFYCIEHPMMAVLEKRDWDCKEIFSTINRISNLINNKIIEWTTPF